jgi:hypothetical protein
MIPRTALPIDRDAHLASPAERFVFIALVLAVSVLATRPLFAQWSGNPAQNMAVCDHTGDQAVPKVAATGDGKTWLGWFDNTGGSYAVYVQLLDADGAEQFPHNGLLVSSNSQAGSLVDWDLIADSQGNCVLAFTDTRAGTDLDVYAYRISPGGTFLWGANGVTLSSNADYEPSPKVTETSDGNFVFVWPRIPNSGTGSIRIQKLDPAGNLQYAADGIPIPGGSNEHPAFCDVVAADNGSFVVEWVRDIATFQSPRHLRAQKFSAAGTAIWASPVAVYDLNSLPIAYQPILQSDGAGGALFCWHRSLNNVYDSLVQHLDSNGTEAFAHNGLLVSTEPNRFRLDPSLAFLPASGDLIVGFEKTDLNQSQWGVGIQRISSAGARLWTDNGIELLPVNGTAKDFVRCVGHLWKDRLGQISLAVTTLFWGAGATLRLIVLIWASMALKFSLEKATQLTAVVAFATPVTSPNPIASRLRGAAWRARAMSATTGPFERIRSFVECLRALFMNAVYSAALILWKRSVGWRKDDRMYCKWRELAADIPSRCSLCSG